MQRFGGAGFCAFVTENALSCVFSLARFFVDFNIHRTNLQALATMDAFIFITMDVQKPVQYRQYSKLYSLQETSGT